MSRLSETTIRFTSKHVSLFVGLLLTSFARDILDAEELIDTYHHDVRFQDVHSCAHDFCNNDFYNDFLQL